MRKYVVFIVTIFLLLLSCGCQKEDTVSIGIIPLDSRPCNTQYAQLLGEMAGYEVLLPEPELLDHFTQPSNPEMLWRWLEQQECNHYILFTNQLMNGGLINSRSMTSYQEQEQFFANLDAFLENKTEQTVTIISVLPRLLPSQYDPELWQYQKELSAYGSALDQALQEGKALPAYPDAVPHPLVEQYLSLYQSNYDMLLKLSQYAKDGVSLVIGQDDAQKYCPSNIIYRAMGELENDNITMLHGADELTMLTVAKYDATPKTLHVIYSDTQDQERYYPYEAADLQTVLYEKAAYVNITIDAQAEDTMIIHTDPSSLPQTQALLQNKYGGYLALADIAYTNKGDIALTDSLLTEDMFQALNCYSGWNTASNTIGTVLAHYAISQNYAGTDSAAKSALAFKLTRYSEDLVYQGHISNALRGALSNQKLMDYTTAFVDVAAYDYASTQLEERFVSYGKLLCDLAEGAQTILPEVAIHCKQVNYEVTFPWARAFEIYARWNVAI